MTLYWDKRLKTYMVVGVVWQGYVRLKRELEVFCFTPKHVQSVNFRIM